MKLKNTITALAALLMIAAFSSCTYDPDSIPYNTLVYRELAAGTYEATSYGTRYELVIGDEEHGYGNEQEAELKLYMRSSSGINQWETTPYVIYSGTYSHWSTEYSPISFSDDWQEQYHIDEFDFKTSSDPDFNPDDMDGIVAIFYDHATAGKEENKDDAYWGQAYYPRLGTIVEMERVYDEPYEDTPDFIMAAGDFTMVSK